MQKKVVLLLVSTISLYVCAFSSAYALESANHTTGNTVDLTTLSTAAAQGNAKAQFTLGLRYLTGNGVTQSDEQAFVWMQKSAAQNYPEAEVDLASLYFNGKGVEKDSTQALNWLQKAADQGFAPAESKMGEMNYNGKIMPQSYLQAIDWYRKAALQNYAPALNNLAFMYEKGYGVPQDSTEAFNWALRAAQLNMPVAEWEVGAMYEKGEGVSKNLAQASYWYNKAQAAGYTPSKDSLSHLGQPQPLISGQSASDQAKRQAIIDSQNKELDPNRGTHISKAFLSNNIHPLKLITSGQLAYSKEAISNHEFGTVILWPSVNESGRVTNVTIHRSSGYEDLDMAAQAAVMHNVYAPYIDPDTGEARAVQTEQIVNFTLPAMEALPLNSALAAAPRVSQTP